MNAKTVSANGWPMSPSHVARAKGAEWDEGLRAHFAYRDLGMATASGGRLRAHVIRATKPCAGPGEEHTHALDFQMVYVLQGWARVWYEDIGEVRVVAGDCFHQKPGVRHRVLDYSDDYTVLEITIPADFETVTTAL
jgi:quercetin dioxygenase-like cupin family protein